MSIATEITRLQTAKANIKTAIEGKGVTVPSATKLDGYNSLISSIPTKQTESWHQCPEAVRNYIANVTYDPSDYSTSQITTYAPATAVTSNTKPIGKTIDGVTYYNNVPNVATPFSSSNTAGTVTPLDALRWLNSSTDNVRDLGGWACDGGTVKYGMLVRGGEINIADTNLFVKQVGIRRELNLRGDTSETESVLGDSIYFYRTPAFTQYTLNNQYMVNALQFVFDGIKHNEPIYFHCQYGADRTGTVACILEALLGMSQSDIDKDYEITSFYSGTWHANVLRARNESEWQGFISEINNVTLYSELTDTFRNRVISYVLSLGFTVDELNEFRALVIDGNPEPIIPIPTYTNVFNPSTALLNTRLKSAGTTAVQDGSIVTDYIDVHNCTKTGAFCIYFKNVVDIISRTGQYPYVFAYDENKGIVNHGDLYNNYEVIDTEYGRNKIYKYGSSMWANSYYLSFSFFPRGTTTALTLDDISNIIITLNEPIE